MTPDRSPGGSGKRPHRGRSLRRNTAALGVGYVVRVPVILGYFLLATRSLGVETYGVLVAVVAVCTIAGPFAALGSTNLLVKHVAQDATSARTWLGSGLAANTTGAALLGTAVLLLAPVLLPPGTPAVPVALLLLGELVLSRSVELSSAVFVATERMHVATLNQLGLPLTRLGAVSVLVLGPWPVTLTTWALAAVLGALIWATVAQIVVMKAVGRPRWSLAPVRREWRQGLLFATGGGVNNVYHDADKVVLARLVGPEAAGVYGAAFRLLDAAYTPVRALLGAAYPRIFRHGAAGSAGLVRFLGRIALPAVGYAVVATVGVVVLAPLVPAILGPGFEEARPVLVGLSVLLVLRTLHALPADALTGSGHQGRRTVAQLVLAVFNVVALLVLVPRWGVEGAIWSTVLTRGLLAAVLWTLWWFVCRQGGGAQAEQERAGVPAEDR